MNIRLKFGERFELPIKIEIYIYVLSFSGSMNWSKSLHSPAYTSHRDGDLTGNLPSCTALNTKRQPANNKKRQLAMSLASSLLPKVPTHFRFNSTANVIFTHQTIALSFIHSFVCWCISTLLHQFLNINIKKRKIL